MLCADPSSRGVFISVPVWKSGNIPLHAYRSPWTSLLKPEMLDVIYVLMNLMLKANAQAYLATGLSIKQPVGFYSVQKKIFPESAVRSVHKRAWASNPHLGSQIKWLPLRSPRWSNKFAHWALGLLDYCYKRIYVYRVNTTLKVSWDGGEATVVPVHVWFRSRCV